MGVLHVVIINPNSSNCSWELKTSHININSEDIGGFEYNNLYSIPVLMGVVVSDKLLAKTSHLGRWDFGAELTNNSYLLVMHLGESSRSSNQIEPCASNLEFIANVSKSSNRSGYLMLYKVIDISNWSLDWAVRCPVTDWVDRHVVSAFNQKSFKYMNYSEETLDLIV